MKLDVITANNGNGTVSLLLGTGAGGLGAPVNFTVGTNPQSLLVTDLNGDKLPDVVVANFGASSVHVLLGNGIAGFNVMGPIAVGMGPRALAIGDGQRV